MQAVRLLQALQVVTLFVEDVEADRAGDLQDHRAGALEGLGLDRAQGGQGAGLDRADAAGAFAMFADVGRAFQDAGAATLAADLHQAEARDLAHLDASAVVLERVLQNLLDRAVVLAFIHVDEVDDDQAGQVA